MHNSHFTNLFANNGQVGYFWQFIFYTLGCIISIICSLLFTPLLINNTQQDPYLLLLLSPIVSLVLYCINISFQSLLLKISQSPLIKYFGSLIAIELLLLLFVIFGAEGENGQTMSRYIGNRLSLFGFLFINLPSVFNNVISFLIELWHLQMVKNNNFNSNLLDDNFDHHKNNNENGA